MTRPAKPTLSLAKIDLEEKVTDLRLRLRGKLAVDLVDYQRAYAQSNAQEIALEQLVPHILSTFMEADRGFQAWRKANPVSGAS
ncbi:DUF2274 domain-containing protein [Caulobacter sp. DWP3-1-3b2]|uniref:DUF2274 domain-containing protein n=1 Tax=Caulobacter sp. DWP3-1-3b2 TaxID=2804643 RepID=UPI003CEDCB81